MLMNPEEKKPEAAKKIDSGFFYFELALVLAVTDKIFAEYLEPKMFSLGRSMCYFEIFQNINKTLKRFSQRETETIRTNRSNNWTISSVLVSLVGS